MLRWVPALGLSAITATTSISTASSEPLPTAIFSAPAEISRTLVGDFEEPDMVALVYSESWFHTYVALLDIISASRPVVLLAESGQDRGAQASIDLLPAEQRTRVWQPGHTVDSAWVRDYGPLQAHTADGDIAWLDTPYSLERLLDDDLPPALGAWLGRAVEPFSTPLDGGSLASNGRGLCVSTTEYFEEQEIELNPATDPSLLEQLGCKTMALVPALAYEDTKHADLVLQFLAPDLVVVARFDPALDPEDARRADTAASVLRRAARRLGQPLTIARVDSPGTSTGDYRSYVNFLQLGDLVLVPEYDTVDPEIDQAALSTLATLVPDRTLVRIPADDPSDSGGSLHCLTWGLHLP